MAVVTAGTRYARLTAAAKYGSRHHAEQCSMASEACSMASGASRPPPHPPFASVLSASSRAGVVEPANPGSAKSGPQGQPTTTLYRALAPRRKYNWLANCVRVATHHRSDAAAPLRVQSL